jgi:transposase
MYIRKSKRKHGEKIYTSHSLVESYRTEKGPRQRTICSLGDLRARSRKNWLKLIHKVEDELVGQQDWLEEEDDTEVDAIVQGVETARAALCRQGVGKPQGIEDDVVGVHLDGVRTEHHREAGAVHVGYQFWKRLELDSILAAIGLNKRSRELTCVMTMNRLIAPKSEHAMPDWIRRTALADILQVDFAELADDALYRNLDRLHPNRAAIESALVERERTLFNLEQTVFLYDLTSTYFEGQALANPKAKRGYSRDKRPDCKQVVVGLVINRDGFPLAHEIFEGNRQDRTTVKEMLELLDKRVGLVKGQTVVVDRGMAFDENLAEIRARHLHYLVAARQPERDQWLEEFEELVGFDEVIRKPSPRNPYQKKSQVRVKMKRTEAEETHVLCISSERTEKDRAIRKKHETRLLADLDKLAKRIAQGRLVKAEKVSEAIGRLKERYPRVARYYKMTYAQGERQLAYELDQEKHAQAEQLDGSYLLKSDRDDLSADEAWRIYVLLTRVENAFRNMKSPLAERPIYHQLEHRVETHIFLCVLAYHLLVAIEKTLLDRGVHTSWGSVREVLSTHQVCTIVLPTDDGRVLRIRKGSTPEPAHTELYELLDIPKEIIRPTRTSEPQSGAEM